MTHKGRFSCPVWPYERHTLPMGDAAGNPFKDLTAIRVCEIKILNFYSFPLRHIFLSSIPPLDRRMKGPDRIRCQDGNGQYHDQDSHYKIPPICLERDHRVQLPLISLGEHGTVDPSRPLKAPYQQGPHKVSHRAEGIHVRLHHKTLGSHRLFHPLYLIDKDKDIAVSKEYHLDK